MRDWFNYLLKLDDLIKKENRLVNLIIQKKKKERKLMNIYYLVKQTKSLNFLLTWLNLARSFRLRYLKINDKGAYPKLSIF